MRTRIAVVATVMVGAASLASGSAFAASPQHASIGAHAQTPNVLRYFTGTGVTADMARSSALNNMEAYDPACVVQSLRSEHEVMGGWKVTIAADCPA
ncbi:hypothetical protein ACFZAV_43890 [Streptomyces sp. NPDC008343]|uniref:hypothetical protein n=1 Tax=Streptomyces sp. NPDC008343 TaxID=3364828 RepID=UPI0036EE8859